MLLCCKFLCDQTAEYVWNVIIDFWVTLFNGFPYIIAHDQGSQFGSDFSRLQFGVATKSTTLESHNSLSLCKRHHSIIRRAFRKVLSNFPTLDINLVLSTAVHAVNKKVGPHGLTPSLLVFGASPKLPIGSLSVIPKSQNFGSRL